MSGDVEIRHAVIGDAKQISELEGLCFPESEAASGEDILRRLQIYPKHFWLMVRDGNIITMINGMTVNCQNLLDEMYENADMHDESGTWQMIFSVATRPEYRSKGYASGLMKRVISDSTAAGKSGLVLTCKEPLVAFYEKFGFVNEGVSSSVHGNAVWYQMRKMLEVPMD